MSAAGVRWRYTYDPFGRRIRKQKVSAENAADTRPAGTEYRWSGDQMIAETPVYADGTVAYDEGIHWLYVPGSLTPAARYQKGQLHYVVSDHMGTPRELLTEQGKVAWAGRLSTWGEVTEWPVAANDADKLSCNLRFAGQYADEESGLHYNRFRYYDNGTGQYLSPDPIALAGGINPYSYVSNPLSFIDPLGLCKGEVTGKYSAINPGPLSDDLAGTFAGGKYKEIILSQDTELYRAGVEGRPFGQFFSSDKPQSVLQTRIDKAVLPNWPGGGTSPLDSVFKLKIPAGTKAYVGEVGYQNGVYLGGTQQIVIPKSWDIPGVQVLEQGPLP